MLACCISAPKQLTWLRLLCLTAVAPTGCRRYAQAAVLSAQENSPNLVPILIFADQQPESDANTYHDMLNWFREHGCLVYHHRLTFLKDIQVSVLLSRVWQTSSAGALANRHALGPRVRLH